VSVSNDLSNGRINVNIPLVTLDSKGVSMPISLIYNYSGYKTDDVASWVGSGWNIAGTGSVVRNVNGFPDDQAILVPNLSNYVYEGGYLRNGRPKFGPWDAIDKPYIAASQIDLLPDVFTYNSPVGTGVFILDK